MKIRLHKAAYGVIYKVCFKHLCLDYENNLVIVLKDLSQDKNDTSRNNICMTVNAYDTYFWNVTCHLQAMNLDAYGQDLCPVYLAGLNNQVKKYAERNYPDFHCRVDTTCDVQRATLKVIFDHAYKSDQESISFALNLKQHLLGADGSMFVASAVAAGAATKPEAASHPT
jgi:hypothetical protein